MSAGKYRPMFGLSLAIPAFQALLGAPLLFGMIGPNGVYGFRTPQSLASAQSWYALNRVAGGWLVGTALLGALISWAIWKFLDVRPRLKLAFSCLVAVATLTIATIAPIVEQSRL